MKTPESEDRRLSAEELVGQLCRAKYATYAVARPSGGFYELIRGELVVVLKAERTRRDEFVEVHIVRSDGQTAFFTRLCTYDMREILEPI